MNFLISINSVPLPSADLAPAIGTPQFATSGNPVGPIPATVLPGYWVNMVMTEIVNAVEASGQTPSSTDWTQLSKAIMAISATGSVDFQTSAAWTVPAGVYFAKFEVWGSTSGSGGSASSTAGGGAGGASYSKKTIAVIPGAVYTFTSGAGGAGGGTAANGAAGGVTTLTGTGVAISIPTSGIGVGSGSGGAGGAGAAAGTGGDINLGGGNGSGAIVNGTLYLGGTGGSSPFGGGITSTTVGTPQVGNIPGGGAGGGANSQNGSPGNAGYMRVSW